MITDGFTSVQLSPGPPVTVDRLWFQQPHGIRQTAAFVVPGGSDPYGDVTGDPPSQLGPDEPAFDWAARQNAAGAVLRSGITYNLLAVGTSTTTPVTEQGVQIQYHGRGHMWILHTQIILKAVLRPKTQCP